MEADAYLSVYETLEKKAKLLHVPLRNACPLNKIVWSSFDYMTGPELKFVWEATASSEPLSPVDLSAHSSRDESRSLNSSTSDQAGDQFEEIDDAFRSSLLTAAVSEVDICRNCMRADCNGDDYCNSFAALTSSPVPGTRAKLDQAYLDAYMMTESRSTLDGTIRSSEDDDDSLVASRHRESFTMQSLPDSEAIDETEIDHIEQNGPISANYSYSTSTLQTTSLTNLHAASIKESKSESDANTLLMNGLGSDAFVESYSAVVISTPRRSPDNCLNESDCNGERDPEQSENAYAMIESTGVDSGIAGTISTHSDLSALCQSPEDQPLIAAAGLSNEERRPSSSSATVIVDQLATDDDIETLDDALADLLLNETAMESTSDEEYVARFALAELICSHAAPTDPLTQKLLVISRRRLVIGSFLFSAKRKTGRRTALAISMLLHTSRLDWYLERRPLIESVLIDIIPKVKASFATESDDETICRMTTAFGRLWTLLGTLDRWPLCSIISPVRLRQTHFSDSNCDKNDLLARAITAVFVTGGRCVVLGDKFKEVNKMLLTLSIFLPEREKWRSLMPFKHPYSPYLRLQAVKRKELPFIIAEGIYSDWPIAVVDLDRRLVAVSAQYHGHRVLKKEAQIRDVREIFEAAGRPSPVHNSLGVPGSNRSLKIELRPLRAADPLVSQFLQRMQLLQMERAVRFGFADQFGLYWENAAHSLLTWVEDASLPRINDKRGSAVSGAWSLQKARKALDLRSDCRYSMVLAAAERLCPDFAEFVCKTSGR